MTRNRPIWLSPKLVWIAISLLTVLVVSLAIGGCADSATPTPTPTKTPRPTDAPTAVPNAVPGSPTVDAASASISPTAPVAGATLAPTDSPAETPKPADTLEPDTPTAKPPAPTAVVSANSLMSSPDYGVQAFLWWRSEVADRDLQLVKDAGFGWVKQWFSWQDIEGAGKGQFDWTNTDRIVQQVESAGLKLIVRVSEDPDRPFWAGSPPDNAGNYADFLAALASRYHGKIQAYQIWNEPNLAREWGGKAPDPAGYARMLKMAYSAIKTIDPNAIVVTAGMAPTGTDNEVAMPDVKYYEQMYQAMGGNSTGYFDMLGVHAAGYAAPPELSPDEAAADKPKYGGERFFAFRHVEDVRAVMERYGDQGKRVVILEFGWTTDSVHPEYSWHGADAGIDEALKGKYMVRAYQYAAEHWQPWIALMSVIYMPDVNWTKDDEQYWWSIIGPGYPDLYLRNAYVELCIYLNGMDGQRCKYDPNP